MGIEISDPSVTCFTFPVLIHGFGLTSITGTPNLIAFPTRVAGKVVSSAVPITIRQSHLSARIRAVVSW